MSTTSMNTEISTKELTLEPGESPTTVEVVVINTSDRFASFQLQLFAAGVESVQSQAGKENNPLDWYTVTPEICTKKPPGDQTHFKVTLLRSPIPGFIGLVNLTVKVFSLELGSEERHILRLHVTKSAGESPFQLDLPQNPTQTFPSTEVEIPVRLYNSSPKAIAVAVSCLSPKREWFMLETQTLKLPNNQWTDFSLLCRVPDLTVAVAQAYPFTLNVTAVNQTPAQIQGTLDVLPIGVVELEASPKYHRLPQHRPWLPQFRIASVIYQLEFSNRSNLPQQVKAEILKHRRQKDRQLRQLAILPEQIRLEQGDTQILELSANAQRPWLGPGRTEIIEVAGQSTALGATEKLPVWEDSTSEENPQIYFKDPLQNLELKLLPIIPRWLQLLLAFLILGLFWGLWYFQVRLNYHTGPVNSVEFNGLGNRVISASNDQSLRGWRIKGKKIQPMGLLGDLGKAGRTNRYRPVNNNRVAVGLENGEIQIWNLLSGSKQPARSLSYRRDDRVMDLAFTKDSQFLFSAHGSGLLLQWLIGPTTELVNVNQPQRLQELDFAIYDLAFVGLQEKTIAIAGRYNQLVLWDWESDRLQAVPYQTGGQDEYITSLATAEEKPFFLATADDRGYISLWNLRNCLQDEGVPCNILEQWQVTDSQPIRSLALTDDGCYLASTGDDGKVTLWNLQRSGERSTQNLSGQVIVQLQSSLNSVDLIAIKSDLVIVTGGDDYQVRLHRIQRPTSSCY